MKIFVRKATKEGRVLIRDGGVADLLYPKSLTRRGRVIDNGNVSPTLMSDTPNIHRIESDVDYVKIRRLTPKECWRLMDFTDADFEKASAVNSDTQLYKQAGNSIVVNVLVAILGQMFEGKEEIYKEVEE
jgi:DNA (cytosine-5)-methyltransferase 1